MRCKTRRSRAQTLVEYGLLVCLLAVVALVILQVLGRKNRDVYVTVHESTVSSSAESSGGGGRGGPPAVRGHW